MFTSLLSSAFMTLCLNLMLPLHLRRSKHFPAYSLLFRLDKTLVPRTFMLPNNPQQRVNLCYYIHYNFFSSPNRTIYLYIRIRRFETLNLDKINMVVLPLAML